MGNTEDSRIAKTTVTKQPTKRQPQPQNQQNQQQKSEPLKPPQNPYQTQPVQNERINPYDARFQSGFQQQGNAFGNKNNTFLTRSFTVKNKNTVSTKMLKDAFRTYCIDGTYLNRSRFNDAIESIFRFNIPEMHYTYLSDKIYDLLDDSGDGKIQEDEFLQGFSTVLRDKNYRVLLSFMAMMSLPDKSRDYIEVNEIKEFFFKSYVQGYKHLGWQLKRHPEELKQQNLPIATIAQLGIWAQKYEKEVKNSIENDLRQFDPNIVSTMTFDQFSKWIYTDHVIYIQYGNKNIKVATSLIGLDEIQYDDSMTSSGNMGARPFGI